MLSAPVAVSLVILMTPAARQSLFPAVCTQGPLMIVAPDRASV